MISESVSHEPLRPDLLAAPREEEERVEVRQQADLLMARQVQKALAVQLQIVPHQLAF